MRSEGFSFYILGVWGWTRVRVSLLLASAIVRNRRCVTLARVKLQCLWEKLPKRVFLDVSEDVVMSFCVAGMALCDIRRVSGGMCVRDRREGKVAVSMGKATKTCLSRRVRRFAHVVLRGRHGTL